MGDWPHRTAGVLSAAAPLSGRATGPCPRRGRARSAATAQGQKTDVKERETMDHLPIVASERQGGDATVVSQRIVWLVLPLEEDAEVLVEMDGELRYEADDPYAVSLSFDTGEGTVRWRFARDLLLEGCSVPVGEGDVQVRPCLDDAGRRLVQLQLSSSDGAASLIAPATDVTGFGRRVLTVVPPGTEPSRLDLDHVIDRLLRDAQAGGPDPEPPS